MKPFLAAWMLLLLPSTGLPCDVCGIFLGVQPNDRTSSISLLWRYRHLEGTLPTTVPAAVPKHGGHSHAETTPTADVHYRELYQVAELRADLWLTERWALLVSVPAVNNYRAVDGVIGSDIYGLGDPLLIGRYQVANTKCLTTDERTVHRLLVGAGANVPLGRTDRTYKGYAVDVDQQPGTGSWDALATLEYRVRRGRNGAGLTAIGRYNGANSDTYRLGHGLSTTAEVFRRWDFGEHTKWMPSVGLYHELAGMDAEDGTTVQGTGSSTLFTHVGSRVWWRSWGLSATFQLAVAHSLGDRMVPNRERVVLGISYNLVNS